MADLFEEVWWRQADESVELYNCPDHTAFNLIYGRIYTVGQGYRYSDTNNFISNLKINPNEARRIRYKDAAISQFTNELTAFLQSRVAGRAMALIPVPPSKSPTHADYDDRIIKVANGVAKNIQTVRCWPILECSKDRESLHFGSGRSVEEVYSSLSVNAQVAQNSQEGEIICLLDDVLTSGASFSAARRKLLELSSNIDVMGIFWAKAQYPTEQFEDIEF